ncbi:MAG: hypothetical protein H2043_06380 [Rhizobiales bacterium]|nr:hypothetical protein [Hyphomicrobiales bacterium]
MSKYYVDPNGRYLGGFDGAEPEHSSLEVPYPPDDARQIWEGKAWLAVPLGVEDFESAVQAHIDNTAQSKLFRDGVTLASYTASTNPQWSAEALAFVSWRDAVWSYALVELEKFQSGVRGAPTPAEFCNELPLLKWPD